MEQKDYLMREIEKIGLILRSVLGRLFNKADALAIEIPGSFQQTKDLLFNELNFELDEFLTFDESAGKEYLSQHKGFNTTNLGLLAEILFRFGGSGDSEQEMVYHEKALQILELCNEMDKTYSIPREGRIAEIKDLLG